MRTRSEWLFLPPDLDPYGVVAIGGDLGVARLLRAYRAGVFPWPQDGQLVWFSPQERGVLFLNEVKFNKRYLRAFRNSGLEFRWNERFEEVIHHCAVAKRKGQSGTWITQSLEKAYVELHKAGHAQSIEAYRNGALVGGLYGVLIDGVFSAESVFGLESDVAKHCLFETLLTMQQQGLQWIDIQMVTPLTQGFGGRILEREKFLELLKSSQSSKD